jgi:hypothetical protein
LKSHSIYTNKITNKKFPYKYFRFPLEVPIPQECPKKIPFSLAMLGVLASFSKASTFSSKNYLFLEVVLRRKQLPMAS